MQEANNLKQRRNQLTCQGRLILEQCKNADDNNLWKELDKSDLERALNKVQNMKLTENNKEMMMFDIQAFAKKRENKVFVVDVDKFKSELGDAVRDLEMKVEMTKGQHGVAASVLFKYER